MKATLVLRVTVEGENLDTILPYACDRLNRAGLNMLDLPLGYMLDFWAGSPPNGPRLTGAVASWQPQPPVPEFTRGEIADAAIKAARPASE